MGADVRHVAEGNISIYAPANEAAEPIKKGDLQKATFALWVGQPEIVFLGSQRSSITIDGTSVNFRLTDATGQVVALSSFGDFNARQMAWYLISIDATQADNADKIKVWRKPEGSPYPAERLPMVSQTTEFAAGVFTLARDNNFGSYYQRIYGVTPDDVISRVSDFWHRDAVALEPTHFWNDSGYPYNVDNVRATDGSIIVPRVRMGGSHTESKFVSRANSGSDVSPLPAENPGADITRSGVISVGD